MFPIPIWQIVYLSYIPRSTRNRSTGDISFILSIFSRISVSAAYNCSSVRSMKSADMYVIRASFVRFSILICAMPAHPFQPNSLSHSWILYALLILTGKRLYLIHNLCHHNFIHSISYRIHPAYPFHLITAFQILTNTFYRH